MLENVQSQTCVIESDVSEVRSRTVGLPPHFWRARLSRWNRPTQPPDHPSRSCPSTRREPTVTVDARLALTITENG